MAELPEPRTEAGRRGLAALRADPAGALVALDYDGVLAPIVDDPAQAGVDRAADRADVRRASPSTCRRRT